MRGSVLAVTLIANAACLPGSLSASAPVSDVHRVTDIVLEGTLEVLIEDSDQRSRILYFLTTGGRRLTLQFERPPGSLTSGLRVRASGRWVDKDVFLVSALKRL